MEDTYKTISKPSEGLFKEKGSKFISYAFPVSTEDEIKNIVQKVKKEHHSARHHCFAWRLGHEKLHFRVNDDGEPSSTAGKPIIGQIQNFGLTNILIIVVRYFGGILLGTNGLIIAYRCAAFDAINQAEIVEKIVKKNLLLKFDYVQLNEVMKVLKDEKLPQVDPKFDQKCSIGTQIRLKELSRVEEVLKNVKGLKVSYID